MQNIQEMSSVVGEERRDQRIGDRLQRPVRYRKNKGSQPEVNESRLRCHPRHGAKGDQCRYYVERKRRGDQFAIADFIHDDSANDNTETESREPGPVDQARFEVREVKIMHPIAENAATNS